MLYKLVLQQSLFATCEEISKIAGTACPPGIVLTWPKLPLLLAHLPSPAQTEPRANLIPPCFQLCTR